MNGIEEESPEPAVRLLDADEGTVTRTKLAGKAEKPLVSLVKQTTRLSIIASPPTATFTTVCT